MWKPEPGCTRPRGVLQNVPPSDLPQPASIGSVEAEAALVKTATVVMGAHARPPSLSRPAILLAGCAASSNNSQSTLGPRRQMLPVVPRADQDGHCETNSGRQRQLRL